MFCARYKVHLFSVLQPGVKLPTSTITSRTESRTVHCSSVNSVATISARPVVTILYCVLSAAVILHVNFLIICTSACWTSQNDHHFTLQYYGIIVQWCRLEWRLFFFQWSCPSVFFPTQIRLSDKLASKWIGFQEPNNNYLITLCL